MRLLPSPWSSHHHLLPGQLQPLPSWNPWSLQFILHTQPEGSENVNQIPCVLWSAPSTAQRDSSGGAQGLAAASPTSQSPACLVPVLQPTPQAPPRTPVPPSQALTFCSPAGVLFNTHMALPSLPPAHDPLRSMSPLPLSSILILPLLLYLFRGLIIS